MICKVLVKSIRKNLFMRLCDDRGNMDISPQLCTAGICFTSEVTLNDPLEGKDQAPVFKRQVFKRHIVSAAEILPVDFIAARNCNLRLKYKIRRQINVTFETDVGMAF